MESLKIDRVVFYFIIVCFLSMAIPYVLDLGGSNVFLKDFYAKRLMVVFSLPFYVYLIFLLVARVNANIKINKDFVIYFFVVFIILANSFLKGNSLSLIVLDTFIVLLPFFFYILLYKTSFDINSYKKDFFKFLLISSIIVSLGIKLQFSYFTLLAIVYIIFFAKPNSNGVFLIVLLPFLVVNSLIGKSSLIMLAILIGYFFLFDRKLVSRKKKIYLVLIPTTIIILSSIVFWNKIEQTGAYRNTTYFLKNADFKKLKFKDMSTGHRLFEAERVIEEFNKSSIYFKMFGKGFGATIDLSETKDVAVINSNTDLSEVRHIHIGFFAVLHRYGLVGLLFYFLFIKKVLISCYHVLRKSRNICIVLSALYLIIIIFDSFITFPHMMSNIMFWLITFVIFKESQIHQNAERISASKVIKVDY